MLQMYQRGCVVTKEFRSLRHSPLAASLSPMASERLAKTFAKAKAEGRLALITYVVPGHPSVAETPGILDAQIEGGADIIEVGIPFSDPLADGTTIQRVAFEALQNGMTPAGCMTFAADARKRHPDTPLVLMTYLNPVLAYGLQRFADDAAAAGVDAVILTDLPPEEAGDALSAFKGAGLDVIFLVAPTSSDHRLEVIGKLASGFVYCVSVAGVTGARSEMSADLPAYLARVRRCTAIPLTVGFGISRREHIESLAGIADGAVSASAIMALVSETPAGERTKAVREYVEVLSGRRRV
jgi:tryptophan synthase alpha subunit